MTTAGIDVAKEHLDLALRRGDSVKNERFANTSEGADTLTNHLEDVLEATGGYERSVAAALGAAGLPVAVVNPRQARDFAKLVGVAPLNRDSGKYRGKRGTWGGRESARSALYMAALVATRCNERLSDFYRGLVDRGKAKKVALVATMRKLLVILNTMAKNGEPWQPDLHRASA